MGETFSLSEILIYILFVEIEMYGLHFKIYKLTFPFHVIHTHAYIDEILVRKTVIRSLHWTNLSMESRYIFTLYLITLSKGNLLHKNTF